MSGSRHTPGPWRWDEDGNLVAADGKRVLTAATFLLDHRELAASIDAKEPDAALVAAAPELLEALKNALGVLFEEDLGNRWGHVIDPISSLIARAEGREP